MRANKRATEKNVRSLLVINFVVDADDPVLGFAVRWLEELQSKVERLVVVTGRVGRVPDSLNVEIVDTNWVPAQNIRNVLRFQWKIIRTLRAVKPSAAFTHMAAIQGLLASPWLRLLGVRHVLWYAHPHLPKSFRFAMAAANAVVTSVPESCPAESGKVMPIGQGIDTALFPEPLENDLESPVLVHWGRCDPVKRLDYLAEVVDHHSRDTGRPFSFLVVGEPSTEGAAEWWREVLETDSRRDRRVIEWIPGLPQSELPCVALRASAFIHASCTGFDKAALEAALLGLPVFSEAVAIRRELGHPPSGENILQQLAWWDAATGEARMAYCEAQRAAVSLQHSLPGLSIRLLDVLFNGAKA